MNDLAKRIKAIVTAFSEAKVQITFRINMKARLGQCNRRYRVRQVGSAFRNIIKLSNVIASN
jgi:site-specific DNA-cytosine methylase